MLKKYMVTIVAGLLICAIASSQEIVKHEISVWGSGGLSALKTSTNIGNAKNKAGGSVGIGYSYIIDNNWSIGSGLELAFYNGGYTLNEFSDSYDTNDGQYDFVFHTTLKNYKEKQNVTYLNIPIMATFQRPMIGKNNFYISAGFKFGIPVKKSMKVLNADFNNYGYYPEWENPIQDDPYFMGFGVFKSSGKKGNLELKPSCILSVETGLKWSLKDNLGLYTGVYLDYGLNDIKKSSDKKLIQYNTTNPSDYIHNSEMSSYYTLDGNGIGLVDKIHTIAIGLQAKLAFSL